MKQKAIRLKSVDCNTFNPDVHIMLIGGWRDGFTMTQETAKSDYNLDLEIDENRIGLVENGRLRYSLL